MFACLCARYHCRFTAKAILRLRWRTWPIRAAQRFTGVAGCCNRYCNQQHNEEASGIVYPPRVTGKRMLIIISRCRRGTTVIAPPHVICMWMRIGTNARESFKHIHWNCVGLGCLDQKKLALRYHSDKNRSLSVEDKFKKRAEVYISCYRTRRRKKITINSARRIRKSVPRPTQVEDDTAEGSIDGNTKEKYKLLTIDVKPGWKADTKIIFQKEDAQSPRKELVDIVFIIRDKP